MKTINISTVFRALAVTSMLSLSSTSWALTIPTSDAVQGVGVGAGLQGDFWHTPSGATDWYNIAPTHTYLNAHSSTPDGTFTATIIGYGARDSDPIQTFLQADGSSYIGLNANTADSILRLSGFIDITSPSTISFKSGHDDCVQLKIGSEILYSAGINDVAVNSATFTIAGYYPIELVYSDTYFPPPTGSGSLGLTMDTGSGYQTVPTSILFENVQVQPAPEPTTMLLMGIGVSGLAFIRRRMKNSKI